MPYIQMEVITYTWEIPLSLLVFHFASAKLHKIDSLSVERLHLPVRLYCQLPDCDMNTEHTGESID